MKNSALNFGFGSGGGPDDGVGVGGGEGEVSGDSSVLPLKRGLRERDFRGGLLLSSGFVFGASILDFDSACSAAESAFSFPTFCFGSWL